MILEIKLNDKKVNTNIGHLTRKLKNSINVKKIRNMNWF